MNVSKQIIFLMMNNSKDKLLLGQFLESLGYEPRYSDNMFPLEEWLESSIIITDEIYALKFKKDLLRIKQQSGPLFVPLVILLPQNTDSNPWINAGFDEILRLPVQKKDFGCKLQALARLRAQSEAQYRLIFEHINIGIYRLSEDERIILANKSFANTLGYNSAAEIINKNLKELGIRFETSRKEFFSELNNTGKIVGYESVWLRKNGEKFYVRENAIIFHNDEDQEQYYASTIEDITQRKLAEHSLKLSEEKHKDLVEHLPYGLLIQIGNKAVFVNKAITKIFNAKDESQLIGRSIIERIHPNEQDKFLLKIDFVKDNKQVTEVEQQRLLTLDGQIVNAEVMICPTIYEEKQAVQFILHDITARILAEKQIKYMAFHDPLTGLINRAKLEININQLLKVAEWQERYVAIIFLNLNRFKAVNDALGHLLGDKLLCEVADRLKKATRPIDIIARLAGDEFIIVMADIVDLTKVTKIIKKNIMQILSEPYILNQHTLHITASMGISIYPTDGGDAATLIKNADIALNYAKEIGENNYQFCTPAMAKRLEQKASLEENIRAALANSEFRVHFQPIVEIHTGQLMGVEALLRWQHPTEGNIPPNVFIPLAESTGLIVPITHMVIKEVCQLLKRWQQKKRPSVNIAINLSARSFINPDFIQDIESAIKKYKVNPQLITLEITESMLFQDIENKMNAIQLLKSLGMQVSIDDFGTGFSSLNYLRHFTIDKLKIDLSFIRDLTTDPDDALIVKTIISMAHNLNIRVVAEGVETEEQLQMLKEYDCDEVQGFYFSKAISETDLIKYMGL